eukprot:12237076-Alexandrium_andersonii.AAC.1
MDWTEQAHMNADASSGSGQARMDDEARAEIEAEERRRIEADALAAARGGFPQLKIEPSQGYGAGIDQRKEL